MQGEKGKTAQMTWAEVVSEAQHIFDSIEVESETAPTQTGDGDKRKTPEEIEEGTQDHERAETDDNDEGYTLILGRK